MIRKKFLKKKITQFILRKVKRTRLFFSKSFKKYLHFCSKRNKTLVLKRKIYKKLKRLNTLDKRFRNKRNLMRRSFFFKIIRKTMLHKTKALRVLNRKPIFTKKTRHEKKFLIRARYSLLKTKKYLYRKRFPKINGKKNRNFNFNYYNNIDKFPFKFSIGRLVITYLHNNTFINIHDSKKMLQVISAGKLGFRGPKRSTPFSRQLVARKAVTFLLKTDLNILDIYLNTNYNRWYYFIFKEISRPKTKQYYCRYLIISNPRPHGFLRDKKIRRK